MFPFPDGFIFLQRVGRLLPLETICGLLTQRPMSSLGLVLLRDSGLHHSCPQIWTIYRAFPLSLGSVRAGLLLASGVLKSPTIAACREVEDWRRAKYRAWGRAGAGGRNSARQLWTRQCRQRSPRAPCVRTQRPGHSYPSEAWHRAVEPKRPEPPSSGGRRPRSELPPNFHPQIWTVSEQRATQRDSYISLPIPSFPHRNILCHHHSARKPGKDYYPRCNAEEVKARTWSRSRNKFVRNRVVSELRPPAPAPESSRARRAAGQGANRGPRPGWIRVYALGEGNGGRRGCGGQLGPGTAEPARDGV